MRGRAWLAVALALLVPSSARAIGKWERGSASLELTGNIRLLGAFLHYPDRPPFPDDDGLAAGVGRLILKGDLAAEIGYDIHAFIDLSRGPTNGLGGTFSTAGSFVTPYRTQSLTWNFWSDGGVRGQMGLDRASVHARFGRVDLTAGRFPVNDAVAHLFTPNDFFAPFSATAINKAYKPGVDAVRVGVSLGRLSGIEVTGVLGSDAAGTPAWGRSAVVVRANTVLAGFDVALTGGKLAERWFAGGTFQGDLGPINLRGEGHAGFADPNGDGRLGEPDAQGRLPAKIHGRFAVGAGWRSTWHNFSIDAEYAFFSDGASGAADYLARAGRLFPDDLPYLAQHYLGVGMTLDPIPILHLGAVALVNATDGSGAAVASIAYDISDESAFVGGLLAPWGARPSVEPGSGAVTLRTEYGLLPLTAFLECRFHF